VTAVDELAAIAHLDVPTPQCDARNAAQTVRCPEVATWVFVCRTVGCPTGGSLCDFHKAMHVNEVRSCLHCGRQGVMREITAWSPLGGAV
jgi:hypothetical protein